jgi:hypothetical protein
MASGATAGAAQQSSGGASSAATGQNPFQICTNLYAEKNLQGLQTAVALTGSAQQFGGQVNAGQFLRGVHLMVRNSNTPVLILTVNGRSAVTGS